MGSESLNNRNQRHIIERIIVKGNLILDTPTCFGSGDRDGDIDLEILRDSIEDKALLMGSSLAGALRNYLRDRQHGYNPTEESVQTSIKKSILFGGERSDDDGEQSPLIVNDALSCEIIKAELRDGVKINSVTRTAENGAKYDLEFLQAGTKFNLNFELLIDKENNKEQLIRELIISLQGLERGEIRLGIKKNRGFGRCHVEKWQVLQFNLQQREQCLNWLKFPHWEPGFLDKNEYPPKNKIESKIASSALGVSLNEEDKQDKRNRITIIGVFSLASPLLIRSGQPSSDRAPDVVHLKSKRNGSDDLKPILSGTSLAGVLRHRGERIINTLIQNTNQNQQDLRTDNVNTVIATTGSNPKPLQIGNECVSPNQNQNSNIINEIFGFSNENTKQAKASRLIVDEAEINNTTDLVQNRIAIDRFTVGALYGALFDEQPIFGNDETRLVIKLELRQPKDSEIGLLLLLLKDLWTSDLPVGGTSSIGRGRLQGKHATIKFGNRTWKISQDSQHPQHSQNKSLTVDGTEDFAKLEELEKFVAALHQEVNP